jgi:hypothetical protein
LAVVSLASWIVELAYPCPTFVVTVSPPKRQESAVHKIISLNPQITAKMAIAAQIYC